jgi:glycosyltransferase involved in cell wall biosynthesis
MRKRIKLGVIADEFFEPGMGRMGGFGWAARQVSRIFNEDPSQGVDVVFLSGELRSSPARKEARTHDTRVILRRPGRIANWLAARRERFDLLLTIDYNLGYSAYLRSLPRTPAIVWIRDPRSAEEARVIKSLRIPGKLDETPQGLYSFDGRSIARIHNEAQWLGRALLFATPALHLGAHLEAAYGFEPEHLFFLPNDVRLNPDTIVKSERPTVVFLGRLDPIKRPWMFAELAPFFPNVEFRFLGQSHFSGQGAWNPDNLPPNVRFCGHVNDVDKTRLLSEAWVVINTSIHEGMPVSLLEALACETPFLSGVNPGYTIEQFGIITGRTDGDGMQGLEASRQGLERLLGDDRLRCGMGERGRAWVRSVHNREQFLECFHRLCAKAGVTR